MCRYIRPLNAKTLTLMAMLTALSVILTRFLSINLGQYIRIGFGFVPNAIAGMLLGPVYAMMVAGVADVLGAVLFPSGAYFFGFTFTAMAGGAIYGFLFYQKTWSFSRILICKLLIMTVCNLLLNTLWLDILYGKGFFALLPARALKNVIQYPVDVLLMLGLTKAMARMPKSLLEGMK